MAVDIRFQPTPNPNAGKFSLDRPATPDGRPRSYDTVDEAADDPLAHRLLSMPEVTNVFMVADFVTVTKSPDAAWDALVPRVEAAIRDHLS